MFPVVFSGPGGNSTYPEAAIKCDVSFYFLSRGEKARLCGGNVLQGSSRFHRFILSERPSRRNIYTRKHHSNTSTSLPVGAQGDDWEDTTTNKEPKGCWEGGIPPALLLSFQHQIDFFPFFFQCFNSIYFQLPLNILEYFISRYLGLTPRRNQFN